MLDQMFQHVGTFSVCPDYVLLNTHLLIEESTPIYLLEKTRIFIQN